MLRRIALWMIVGTGGVIAEGMPQPLVAQGTYSVFPVHSAEMPAAMDQPTGHGLRVSLTVRDSTVKYVVHALAQQVHLAVGYNADDPALLRRVSVHIVNEDILEALTTVLRGTGLTAKLAPTGETIAIIRSISASEKRAQLQTGTVTGRVTDSASGKGLSGTTVAIAGTKLSTLTSESGAFTLPHVPVGKQLLTVKSFGYKPASRTVTVPDSGRITIRFVLTPTATVLSGVVTTATGQAQRLEVGNDISVINVDSVMRIAPVTNVTQLLKDRVPGLVVQSTSGTPGAPSRLRLRGVSSISGNNDPIVIVDGVRIYSDQSGSGNSGNITNVPGVDVTGGGSQIKSNSYSQSNAYSGPAQFAGPSALDQIDPNSIATIQVMKGPSASALYGSDAANGVIIITTKRGQAGPARWTAAADLGWSGLQGNWPVNYFRFGTPQSGGTSKVCSPYQGDSCVLDSLVAYQAMNAPGFSPLGTGGRQGVNLGVSGGNGTLTYAFSGSASNQTGYLHLPGAIAKNFAETHGFAAPDWIVHPESYSMWGGMGRLDVQLGHSGTTLSFSDNLLRSRQQQSSLAFAIQQLQTTYLTPANLTNATFINRYYERALLNTTTSTNTVTLDNWTPWSWLPIHATVGLNTANLDNSSVLPRNYALGTVDSIGYYRVGRGTNQDETFDLGTSLQQRFVQVALGLNVHTSSTNTLTASSGQGGIPLGVMIPIQIGSGASAGASQFVYNTATYGWYVAPRFNVGSRLFISPGMRFDGGSASGNGNTMNIFPKTDISYLAVDHPEHPLFGVLTTVRPRLAFGISGVQPRLAETLRTFNTTQTVNPYLTSGGATTSLPVIMVSGFGNTDLHPERSRELEGGVDLGFGNDQLTLTLTGYNKTRYDAIQAIPLAPSVAGTGGSSTAPPNFIAKNIGTIRNTGFEASVNARILDTRSFGWSVNANWATDRNRVVNLLAGQLPIVNGEVGRGPSGGSHVYETRVTPGYPLFGIWAKPILGYTDVNNNGLIEPGEVRLADSTVYLGTPYPDYTLAFSTTLTFLNGRLSVNTGGDYTSGLTQINSGANLLQIVANDPASTPSAQAAIAAGYGAYTVGGFGSAIGSIQTVSTLRWTTLSINYIIAPKIARMFRASAMSIALQGSNLGLHSNYRGKDPDVNAFATGNTTEEFGQLPQPRTWNLRVTFGGE